MANYNNYHIEIRRSAYSGKWSVVWTNSRGSQASRGTGAIFDTEKAAVDSAKHRIDTDVWLDPAETEKKPRCTNSEAKT